MKRLLVFCFACVAGCGPALAESPAVAAPVAAGAAATAAVAADTLPAHPPYTRADVSFMQGMIAHHAQALEMTSLVPDRSRRSDIQLLARRIEMSQADEMELMRRWLIQRGEEAPAMDAPHAHHHHAHGHAGHGAGADGDLMPGMLTRAELDRLAATSGPEFDRLFLEFMIRHHEGALVMVADLFAADGGQDAEIFQFASHVDGDQRIEIDRMYRLLRALD